MLHHEDAIAAAECQPRWVRPAVLRYGAASTIRHAPVVVECAVLPPTPTPSAPAQSMEPVATTLVINACCEESRRPLEDRIDAIREEQRLERVEAERRHEQAERRHQELVEEFRASQRTLNGFVSMVAHELKITPPDVVTVSVKLPKTLECHNRRMNDLQSSNQVFSSRLQAAEKENTKLKRKLAELQRRPPDVRVEVKESAIDAAMRAFCKNTNGKKRMRTALHPDKFSHLPKDTQKELEAAAQTIRRVIGL